MKKKSPARDAPSEEYQRFESLARRVLSVPKNEIDKRQARYEKQKKAAKKKKAA